MTLRNFPGSSALRWVRARLAGRPDTEHEQALVRLVVGVILFFYLLPGAMVEPGTDVGNSRLYLGVMIGYLAFAAVVFAGILLDYTFRA